MIRVQGIDTSCSFITHLSLNLLLFSYAGLTYISFPFRV